MASTYPVVTRMQALIQQWEQLSDHKAIFLRCYMLMTSNMYAAIEQQEFNDPAWVNRLLHRFANYYFVALDAYQQFPASAPPVWQLAHNSAKNPRVSSLQNLLLGVNAHINYDLVLTLVDLLRPEWAGLSPSQRSWRYADHSQVNTVIGRTIDVTQDQVLEPDMPFLDWFDKLLGPVDEFLISRLITRWRESVWQNATRLLEAQEVGEQARFIGEIESDALHTGKIITGLDIVF